jgi:hypothetical protein
MNWRPLIALAAAALPTQAAAHDWYTGLRAPDGSLCCNRTDCHELDWSQVRRASGLMPVGPSSLLQCIRPVSFTLAMMEIRAPRSS